MTSRAAFPPYHLLDRGYVEAARDKLRKIERIYHVGQEQAWDGRAVLAGLIAEHGGIRMDEETRRASARVFSIILWGELAAWNIACDLALHLPDAEVKMAASSQAFDEARHFYVMRDYLLALGAELPPLDGFSRKILRDLLDTGDMVKKLIGMQLLVENIALTLFEMVGRTSREPVLRGLMPYFHKDEARHVGLGVLYLPRALPGLPARRLRALHRWQQRLLLMVVAQGFRMHEDFSRLGIDHRELNELSFRHQHEVFRRIQEHHHGSLPDPVRLGLFRVPREALRRQLDFLYPPDPERVPRWQRAARAGLRRALDGVEAALRHAA